MIELIQQRLESYQATNPLEEEQATKEILQEVGLYWKAAAQDVEKFLTAAKRQSLTLWSERFFLSKAEQLS